MMKITEIKIENTERGLITDEKRPRISFAFESEKENVRLEKAEVAVGGWKTVTDSQTLIPYEGEPLKPFTKYAVTVKAFDNLGESDSAEAYFETGRLGEKWQAKWITDASYNFTEKKVSPVPLLFKKQLNVKKEVGRAVIYSTAIGIYELELNGKKVGNEYFAPGFTSYKNTLTYQAYDVTDLLSGGDNVLTAAVAGGWAVGSFVFTRANRITAPRQAFLAEIRVTYKDGSSEIIGTDESWLVTREGNFRTADIYDGETYDASVDLNEVNWRSAGVEKLRISPEIVAAYGAPVTAHETFKPVSVNKLESGELIYDFGQNFAGVIRAEITGKAGQKIVFRHAEVLKKDGSLCREFLRSAKATATYICRDGAQIYSPRLTYMGFRYVSVVGVEEKDLKLTAVALYSDVKQTGSFECSDELINKLQSNIVWSAKSNFVDIPTDCPQRDERMGWTGDIALFCRTACFNFDVSRFLEKWLKDLRAEQSQHGGIPNTIPSQSYGFPTTMPLMAIDFWGDASVLVPWAEYCARGDKGLLEKSFESMKKYVDACAFWARFLSVGKHRYIWHTPAIFHFGDWVAPDLEKMSGWQKRSKWTATASLANTSAIVSRVAEILEKSEDAKKYKKLSEKVSKAYMQVFTDGKGKLKNEFQTAYVLPLYFEMFPENQRAKAAENLANLVKRGDYKIATGFPGTPYILFALADNGRVDDAYKMLLNTECPSWLYEVKAGGTTIWERWDALKADGSLGVADDGTGGMVSFNHYASGAVGDFLYRRVAGIEETSCGYKTFRVKPVIGGGLTYARAETQSPYGRISSSWKTEDGKFTLEVEVPANTECEVELPSGEKFKTGSGKHSFSCGV